MKYMKLGSKPDAFYAQGNCRHVSSDLATDVTIIVGEVKFYLHKFPLMSKSNRLQKLVSGAIDVDSNEILLPDFPGGPKNFEICAKFCYGMMVTLNAYNVVAARCGAEYLEMTEDADRGNLIFKVEVFLNSSLFRSWKDSINVLQTTSSLLPWSEELKVVGRCVDSIASKTSVDPSSINWSYTYNRKLTLSNEIVDDTTKVQDRSASVPKDWWIEDICELDISLYRRVMIAIKSKGRMDANIIGEALKTYAVRWLPDSVEALLSDVHQQRNKSLVETIICLLPSDKGIGCSCSFLLKLLKVAILIGAEDLSREDLIERISLKLDEATASDLLIPAQSTQDTKYDVDLVQCLVHRFMMNENIGQDSNIVLKNEKNTDDFVLGHGPLLNVGKLIDRYLAEIATDPKLALSCFIDLSQSIPEAARPIHDGLYWAIDIYLKEHPILTKAERKKLCSMMDVKKFTANASMHAAQNERLPLRVVVQVLFFEQVRTAAIVQNTNSSGSLEVSRSTTNTDEDLEKSEPQPMTLQKQMSQLRTTNKDFQKNGKLIKEGSKHKSAIQLLPSRSRRIFDKLWVVGKGNGMGEAKSSETSGSSQSPSSMIRGEVKESPSTARDRRHSIS
ncbi:BTB/POZ domain-containing protein NPY1 isoform X1 [Daucus carota subsp. sativus]|uniref:BTB/POZ domain-containing protein NPY1 isoform X1 n=1 Tax=Daucus carota subsp. sativus TaxID=79200 RepID=UPI0007B2FB86|nr:PREDICTED: BTB/POZ domain-containing protein NPY1 isoform X1 [Daucus carota subsp. sativus]